MSYRPVVCAKLDRVIWSVYMYISLSTYHGGHYLDCYSGQWVDSPWRHMASGILVNAGSSNCLLPLTTPSHYLNQCWPEPILSSAKFCDSHLKAILHEINQPSIIKIIFRITYLNFFQLSRGQWIKTLQMKIFYYTRQGTEMISPAVVTRATCAQLLNIILSHNGNDDEDRDFDNNDNNDNKYQTQYR